MQIPQCPEAVTEVQLSALAGDFVAWLNKASQLQWPLLIELKGPMGAGKTTFVRAMLRALGHSGAVKSPTYGLLEPYPELLAGVYHWDLYRLSEPEELEFLGFRDYWQARACFLIEWAEKAYGYLPPAQIVIELLPHTPLTRHIRLQHTIGNNRQ